MRRYSNKGVIAAIIAVVLAVVLVLVCGIGSSWFTNGDFSTWFNSWGKGDEELEQGNEEGGAVIGEVEENGISLMSAKIASADYAEYGVSPLAETAYTLTATITPSDAFDKTVDWSIAFDIPSSTWASGKSVSDYVTVTPSSNGSLTATVQCLQDFGEQIIVTVTSRNNSSAKATCTVDYVKRVESVGFISAAENQGTYYDVINVRSNVLGGLVYSSLDISYSDFTIDNTFTERVYMSAYDSVLDDIGNDIGESLAARRAQYNQGSYGNTIGYFSCIAYEDMNLVSSSVRSEIIYWMIDNPSIDVFCVDIELDSSYGSDYDYSVSIPIHFSSDNLAINVSGVSLNDNSIVF